MGLAANQWVARVAALIKDLDLICLFQFIPISFPTNPTSLQYSGNSTRAKDK